MLMSWYWGRSRAIGSHELRYASDYTDFRQSRGPSIRFYDLVALVERKADDTCVYVTGRRGKENIHSKNKVTRCSLRWINAYNLTLLLQTRRISKL